MEAICNQHGFFCVSSWSSSFLIYQCNCITVFQGTKQLSAIRSFRVSCSFYLIVPRSSRSHYISVCRRESQISAFYIVFWVVPVCRRLGNQYTRVFLTIWLRLAYRPLLHSSPRGRERNSTLCFHSHFLDQNVITWLNQLQGTLGNVLPSWAAMCIAETWGVL